MPNEKKTPEQVLRDDVAHMARFHNREFYDELASHRSQCVENLNDSTLSDNDDPANGEIYHSRDGEMWRDRIALIDRVASEQVHARFAR